MGLSDKFKKGDKVVQVESSPFNEHDFPPEDYPVLTFNGYGFDEQRSHHHDGGHEARRFELLPNVNTKDTNPKDAMGVKKPPMSTVSGPVLQEVGVSMMEGALKYGRHNYRFAGVRSSVYYDAALRHLIAWWEGQDIDPDSGISHLSKAIAGLAVIRDAEINGKMVDDRPPKANQEHYKKLQEIVDELFKKYPESAEAYTQESHPAD